MAEMWKSIEGFENYEVSDDGHVRNTRTGAVLRGATTSYGYKQVRLRPSEGKTKNLLVHRLVATAFHGPPPEGYVCDHKNGVKQDNRADNLEWVSRRENNRRYLAYGPPRARLSPENVRRMRRLSLSGVPYTKLARLFGVSVSSAYRAVVGHSWKFVGDEPFPAHRHGAGAR